MSNSASSFTGVSSGYTAGTPVPADSPIRDNIADAVRRVRETTPLAQSFTNFVTINLVANAQLAAGGTAAMSFLPDDVIETAKIAGANYINVGTLLPFYKDALPEIAQRLNYLDKPWVLDPVAAGIGGRFRAPPRRSGIRRRRGVRNRRGGGAGTVSDRTARQAFLP